MRAAAILRGLHRAGSAHQRPATCQPPPLVCRPRPRHCAAVRSQDLPQGGKGRKAFLTGRGSGNSLWGELVGAEGEVTSGSSGTLSWDACGREGDTGTLCWVRAGPSLGAKGVSLNPVAASKLVPRGLSKFITRGLSKATSRPSHLTSRGLLSHQHSATRSAMAPPLSTVLEGGGRVLSIQSHTVQGYVGNKSAVFPLQLLGFDVDPINSVQFSNHTAYPVWKGQVLNGDQLWELIEGLEANNLLHYTHLLTGYVGSLSFLETILRVLEKLRAVNPDLKYVCDPVLGDQGQLYVKPELVEVYREKVVPSASLLTPNQFEAELLTGVKIDSEEAAFRSCDALHEAGPSKVVITSIDEGPYLLVVGSDKGQGQGPTQRFRLRVTRIPSYFTGTGDLLTALLLGWSNKNPNDLGKAIELSVASVQAVLKRTLGDYAASGLDVPEKEHELRLIQSREELLAPPVTIRVERLTAKE